MKKYFVFIMITITIITASYCVVVFAHNQDYFSGTYLGTSPIYAGNMKYLVDESALVNGLTMSVYNRITDWNSISSRVNVSVVKHVPGMSDAGFIYIRGEDLGVYDLGKTEYFDINGNPALATSNWYSVKITINTNTSVFGTGIAKTNNAIKVMLHEAGHSLKLAHPIIRYGQSDHPYTGLPLAVMNQGLIGEWSGAVSGSIQSHDRSNLIAKWGS